MDWRRARHLASGALLVGSLVSGASVGSVVLLGSATHPDDPIGRLSAHLESASSVTTATRGARAVIAGPAVTARGSRATAIPPPVVTQSSPPVVTQPSVTTVTVVTTSAPVRPAARRVFTTPATTATPGRRSSDDDPQRAAAGRRPAAKPPGRKLDD
jgi:hypothetical protein